MELEKLSFNQLKELLPQFDKNDMFSTLIRREMKNKYMQHKTQKKNQHNNILSSNAFNEASNTSNAASNTSNAFNASNASNENSFSFYKNTSNMSKPPIYPTQKSNSADLSDIESIDHFNIQKNRNLFHNNYLHADNNPIVPKESSVNGETAIDRDKLNMGLFSRFTNEIEINNFKKTQKNTIRLE